MKGGRHTDQSRALLHAYEKGYKVDQEGKLFNPKGKFVKGSLSDKGYRKTSVLFPVGKNTPLFFHRLQAYQKFGEAMFEDGIEVRHLNATRSDNSFNNIAIGTSHDNMMDRPVEQRKAIATIASRVGHKLRRKEIE